jgi:squalene synthase HpnC
LRAPLHDRGAAALAAAARSDPTLRADLAHCAALARSHYENFAIGSLLLPRALRLPLAAIYAALRTADDLADEPGAAADPMAALDAFERDLVRAAAGERVEAPVLRACGAVVRAFELPFEPFAALLRAFRRDLVQRRYDRFEDLLSYCRESADPVGRLVLLLFGERDPSLHAASDALCTGLQLVNHWQGVAEDARRGRVYLPLEDCERFGVDPEQLLAGLRPSGLPALLAFETARARAFLRAGAALVAGSRGRLRVEVAVFRRAGLAACDALERANFEVLARPPRVGARDRLRALRRALGDAWVADAARLTAAATP